MSVVSKAEQTKLHILRKAQEVFSKKGYFLASMDEICKTAGVSKGSVYYHFKGKQDLFIAILEQYSMDWMNKWLELSADKTDAKSKLLALAQYFASDIDSPLTKAVNEFAGSESADPEIREKLYQINESYIPIVKAIISDGIESGEFRKGDVDQLTLVTFGVLAGIGGVCQMGVIKDPVAFHKFGVQLYLDGLGE